MISSPRLTKCAKRGMASLRSTVHKRDTSKFKRLNGPRFRNLSLPVPSLSNRNILTAPLWLAVTIRKLIWSKLTVSTQSPPLNAWISEPSMNRSWSTAVRRPLRGLHKLATTYSLPLAPVEHHPSPSSAKTQQTTSQWIVIQTDPQQARNLPPFASLVCKSYPLLISYEVPDFNRFVVALQYEI